MKNEDLKKLFGSKIKQLRKSQKISQEKLAEKSDLHNTYISRIELGRQSPTIEVIQKIAKALNVEIAELLKFQTTEEEKTIQEITEQLQRLNQKELKTVKAIIATYAENLEK